MKPTVTKKIAVSPVSQYPGGTLTATHQEGTCYVEIKSFVSMGNYDLGFDMNKDYDKLIDFLDTLKCFAVEAKANIGSQDT